MSRLLQFSAVILLGITIWSIQIAYTRGKANIYYYRAESRLNEWAKNGNIKDKQDYQKALHSITFAHELDPDHPHYLHILGRIMQWGIDFGFEDEKNLLRVKQFFLRSSQLRPLWPDPWIDLALLNDYLQGYNQETIHYRDQALKTGPYWDTVTSGVTQLLLKHWNEIPFRDQGLLHRELTIALKRNSLLEQIFYMAKDYQQTERVCQSIEKILDNKHLKTNFIINRNCAPKNEETNKEKQS